MKPPLNNIQSSELRTKLIARCEAQARFCRGASPLYHQLFTCLGQRLRWDDGFAAWLLLATRKRATFDVPLLVLAGLHASVLRRSPASEALAAYYPSTGGLEVADSSAFATVFQQSVDALRDELAAFIATSPVQTNEGARGLCWLLPLTYTDWSAVHLLELGASAGLNLVAEQRNYLVCDTVSASRYRFGLGTDREFTMQGQGNFVPPVAASSPKVLSRRGCDLAPVLLHNEADRLHLASFVWADQPERMALLQRGIEAVLRANTTDVPVQLAMHRLPAGLPDFLYNQDGSAVRAPCVLFNTYLSTYLPDKGRFLQEHVGQWAQQRQGPVLWLQWEHLRGHESPEFGWLGWTADLWCNGSHQHWHLAWVHPHGSRVAWLPGLRAWRGYWLRYGRLQAQGYICS